MTSRLHVPIPVRILFAIDIGFGVAYLLTYLLGNPIFLTALVDLNREPSLPTWYSSVQWFCVAGLLGISAIHNFSFSERKSWLLLALPLVFLGLSVDEIVMIHEKISRLSDALLPGGSRDGTLFFRTGLWVLLGIPFAALFVGLMISIRTYFRHAPGVLVKLCLGMAVTLAGAVGIEMLSNFVPHGAHAIGVSQILAEELCELLGGTIVLWGSYEFLAEHRFAFTLDRVDTSGAPKTYQL